MATRRTAGSLLRLPDRPISGRPDGWLPASSIGRFDEGIHGGTIGWMDRLMDEQLDGWMDGWMDGWIYGLVDALTDGGPRLPTHDRLAWPGLRPGMAI